MGEVVENKTVEEWRSVVGFGEGYYEVSNLGRYRSLDRIVLNNWGTGPRLLKGRVMKPHLRGKYWFASLTVDRVQKSVYIHQLVAKAFPDICGEWFDGCQVDHINCDKNDNTAWNLRVCTAKENMNNPITIEKHRKNKIEYLRTHKHTFLGKQHTEETKRKYSEKRKLYTDEELKEHRKAYNSRNREKLNAYWREYYRKNKDKKRLQAKMRYKASRDN